MKSYEDLERENHDLRKYISLLLGEIELSKKIEHAEDDFDQTSASQVKKSLLEKISKLRNERVSLESKLELDGGLG